MMNLRTPGELIKDCACNIIWVAIVSDDAIKMHIIWHRLPASSFRGVLNFPRLFAKAVFYLFTCKYIRLVIMQGAC